MSGEGINDANPHERVHRYYNFPCCEMYGLEFVVKQLFIWAFFRLYAIVTMTTVMGLLHVQVRGYLRLLYFAKEEFTCDINYMGVDRVKWDISARLFNK